MDEKQRIIDESMKAFPNMSKRGIAKKIYKENKLLFISEESVRDAVRYRTGAKGATSLSDLTNTQFLDKNKLAQKFNFPKPVPVEEYEHYSLTGNKGLIIADVHIPFHNQDAVNIMTEYSIKQNPDFILINGDFADCFEISYFDKEPGLIKFKEEIEMVKQFLKELKIRFPKAKIYYKFGNHEKRFEDYLIRKAPELFGVEGFNLETMFDLFNLGINYIKEDKIIDISGLAILHGHEYKGGITSPANPARTTFLRTKSTALSAHNHQSSEHSEPTVTGQIITTWSIGCLCNLHPKWMPQNKWNHGFAIFTRHDPTFWNIENKKIIEGHVV